ncbi:hypothetical protein TNCV_2521731 [Trichonephila clavipes]|nr:hypothetical protein TNCV_2521731 [Trichonephila clavipes]
MNTLPDRFMSATDPVSRNRCTKSVIVDPLKGFPSRNEENTETPVGLNCPVVLFSKYIIDADSEDENEMNNVAPVSMPSEM